MRRKTPLFPYGWRIRTPSPLLLMVMAGKNLRRAYGGNKRANAVDERVTPEVAPLGDNPNNL